MTILNSKNTKPGQTLRPTKAEKPTLNLVSFKRELFPAQPSDFSLLKERGISVSRIPRDAFLVLQHTFLKGVHVEVTPWVDVFPLLLEQFQLSFDDSVYEFRQEGSHILVHADSVETRHIKFLESQVELLRKYAGRYGFRVRFETKVRKSSVISRLVFAVDPELIPGFYFGSGEDSKSEVDLTFHISASCRVIFIKKLSPIGVPSFNVAFEDKIGDKWHSAFSRGFNFSYLKSEECRKAVDFFAKINSLMTSSKRDE